MSDNRTDSQGSTLKMGDAASPEAFAIIGELAAIPVVSQAYNPRDRTTLADTAPNTHQGFMTEDTFEVEVAYNKADPTQRAMEVACDAKVAKNFQLTYPTSPVTTKLFTGKVMSYTAPYAEGNDQDLMVKYSISKTSVFS